ncbi:hypothetical protein EDB87DRAFT_1616874 [Lactarius vividus]|nr:hypothetical protein EDB87DRAFT_1616874 [Lactarius vividus]
MKGTHLTSTVCLGPSTVEIGVVQPPGIVDFLDVQPFLAPRKPLCRQPLSHIAAPASARGTKARSAQAWPLPSLRPPSSPCTSARAAPAGLVDCGPRACRASLRRGSRCLAPVTMMTLPEKCVRLGISRVGSSTVDPCESENMGMRYVCTSIRREVGGQLSRRRVVAASGAVHVLRLSAYGGKFCNCQVLRQLRGMLQPA